MAQWQSAHATGSRRTLGVATGRQRHTGTERDVMGSGHARHVEGHGGQTRFAGSQRERGTGTAEMWAHRRGGEVHGGVGSLALGSTEKGPGK
jgi:hypothetical protein